MFNVENIVEPLVGHTVARPEALARALGSSEAGSRTDPDRLAQCRSAHRCRIWTAGSSKVDSLIAAGKRAAAVKLLDKIDQRYGGLAAPRSLELAEK